MPPLINCPGVKQDLLHENGEGYGATKAAALKAAREQAQTKLALTAAEFKCKPDCERIDSSEPVFDGAPPRYTAWPDPDGQGFKCTIRQDMQMKIECVKPQQAAAVDLGGESVVEIPVSFPVPELEEADATADIIAYVSVAQSALFVREDCIDDAAEALKAKKLKSGWKLPGLDGVFELTVVADDPQGAAAKAAAAAKEPVASLAYNRRVKKHHKCGQVFPRTTGPCRPVAGGAVYIKGERNPVAFCLLASPEDKCVEYFVELGRVGFYEDEACSTLLREYAHYGWSCVALF